MSPTREQVENLKAQWRGDGSWDIEETPGFEEYREELQKYRAQVEEADRMARVRHLQRKSEELGCPGNTALAVYVERLEDKLERLELKLERLGDRA